MNKQTAAGYLNSLTMIQTASKSSSYVFHAFAGLVADTLAPHDPFHDIDSILYRLF